MPETIIDNVLTGELDFNLLIKWLKNESLEDVPEDCVLLCTNRYEFVACFLTFLRDQTDSILQTNNNALQIRQRTPDKVLSTRRKHRRSISEPTSDDRKDTLSVKSDRRSHESPSKDRKRGRKVKTKLFEERKDVSASSDESRLSSGLERMIVSSTPIKNSTKESPNAASPVTPQRFSYDRCDTPRLSHRKDKTVSLGDYLASAQKTKKRKSRNASEDNESKVELDISNTEVFPEISRKSSSLRSDKRRIKPTNLDGTMSQKSFSLNSFNSECFQQPSSLALEENSVFKNQKVQLKESGSSFEAERSILKQERQKLMEKFNLNSSASVPVTPQTKIIKKDSIEKQFSYIQAESAKVVFKEKIDLLIEIYEVLLKNNLILSLNSEIYFLISVLLSKQVTEDYMDIESKLTERTLMDYLLKSIHNCTYFAVKSLWNLRSVLEVILDKNSLKILGENKKVRSYSGDLAKFLLNCYGLKCEAEAQEKPQTDKRPSNGIVCFNLETDNADNFPSVLSFQNFKKQRDMFYEIYRWYTESQSTGVARSSLRARVKALIASGPAPANHAHLAALVAAHMLAAPHDQESKLSKLQRRLTCPSVESPRLPHFTDKETFYKEFIINAESESFRVHLRDALATELTALDQTVLLSDERNSSNTDISGNYLCLQRKLCLLGKFLGFLAALPYSTLIVEAKTSTISSENVCPKERVFQNSIATRSYSQPAIDIKSILSNAIKTGRITITLPWIVQYLSMLDYTSLRIKYYQEVIKTIYSVYANVTSSDHIKRNTQIFLKSILGWLFDLPFFPQEFYEVVPISVVSGTDCVDLIDECVLFELCPYLREVNVLLCTCKVQPKESYRHITPVSLAVNSEDRMRSKERELQLRLEEELIKSQPSSARRVLEVVTERVTSASVRELAAAVPAARARAHIAARRAVAARGEDAQALLKALQSIYAAQLCQLREAAKQTDIQTRVGNALSALLPQAPRALHAAATRSARAAVARWVSEHWCNTAVLCKDIEAEMHNLIALGDAVRPDATPRDATPRDATPRDASPRDAAPGDVAVSVAFAIINLKEQVCLLLDCEEAPHVASALAACSLACSPSNAFARAPATRAILQLTIDLCVVYVSRKPKEVTDAFLDQLHAVWGVCCPDRKKRSAEDLPDRRDLTPEFRNFEDDRCPTPVTSDEEEPPSASNVKNLVITPSETLSPLTVKCPRALVINPSETLKSPLTVKSPRATGPPSPNSLSVNSAKVRAKSPSRSANSSVVSAVDESVELEFFERVLCPRNVVLLNSSPCERRDVWEALATVLVFMLKHDYLSEDSLTEQCLAVYRQDWPQSILESLSCCMKSVSARWSRSASGKFTLFLEFLAEYCGDMDEL